MGKNRNQVEKILERVVYVLFGVLQRFVLLIVKISNIKSQKVVKCIPTVQSSILLLSATDLAKKIRRKEHSSEEIVKIFIDRIKTIHECCNILVDERFAASLEDARIVDNFLKNSDKTESDLEKEVPLLGVPFTVKESIAVKGLSHTSGLYSRKDNVANKDATAVSLLREAGGIPIAVTNTPEVCCWWETYNPLHGRTTNPYNYDHTSGGSSGGEAVAVAAAGAVVGLGSDFGGSIRIPAAFNGVFGHRPTSSSVPIDGHYPLPSAEESQKHLVTGPITRYAKDLRLVLKILSDHIPPGLKLDAPVDLTKIKIYYMEDDTGDYLLTPVEPSIKKAVKKVALHFKNYGAHVEKVNLTRMKHAMLFWYAVIKTEVPELGRIITNNKEDMNFLVELFKLVTGRSNHTLPVILFGLLEVGNGVPHKGKLHSAVLAEFEELQADFQRLLMEDAVFLYPTHPTAALRHKEALARAFDIGYSAIFNVLGLPATTCPLGFNEKRLPIGVQVVANKYQDRLTLAVAEEIEKAFGGWVPPFPSHTRECSNE